MNLLFILRAIWKRWWILVSVPLLVAILAFFLTLDSKKSYKSIAQLSTGITISDPFDEAHFNVFEERIKFNNLIATLNSPVVISLLSYNLILNELESEKPFVIIEDKEKRTRISQIDLEEAKNVFREKLENFETLTTFNEIDRQLLSLLEIYGFSFNQIRNNLGIVREGQTDYISIVYASQNPELSAFVVNTLCREFIRYYNSMQLTRTNESVETYEKLVEQKRKVLEVKATALEQFKSSQGVLNFNIESENKVEQIMQAESSLTEERKKGNAVRLSLKEVNRQIMEIQNTLARGTSQAGSNSSTNTEILNLQEQIRLMNQRYVSGGLSNQNILDSLNNLRQRLVTLLNNNSGTQLSRSELQAKLRDLENRKSNLEVELAISEENISSINSTLSMRRSNAGSYASKEARIAELQRELGLATQEYQAAQEKYNSALDFSISSNNKIKQVLYGQPAIDPEPSKGIIVTGLSGVSSFVLCLMAIGFLAYIDLSIKTPSNFAKSVNLNLIGSVNQIDLNKHPLPNIFFKSNGNDKIKNTFRELLRKIRYEVENSNKKVILVTSNKKEEGKTTIIQALAYTLSLSKRKVLIVDTNFADNALSRYYKAPPVLEEFVAGQHPGCQLEKLVTKTPFPLVDVIGCKGGNYSPIEVFPSENFAKYLHCFSEHYDYVLLEGAALSEHSDSRELADFVDGVLAVFSAKSVIKESDKESVQFLANLNGKFIGAVLNQVEADNMDH